MSEIGEHDGPPGSSGPGSWVAPGAPPPPTSPAPPTSLPPPTPPTAPASPPVVPVPPGWTPLPGPAAAPTPHPAWGTGAPPPPLWINPLAAHRPGIIPLRPLTVGDILQAVFTAIRRSPGTYLGLTLLTWAAFLVVAAVIGLCGLAFISATDGWGTDVGDAVLISGVLLLSTLSGVVTAALCGMFAYPANQQAIGRTPTVGETWRRTRARLAPLFGLYVLVLLVGAAAAIPLFVLSVWSFTLGGGLILVGLLLLAVIAAGATWLSVRLAFCLPAVVVEGCGVTDAIRRSFGLTAGRFWRTFAVLFLVIVLTSIASTVISGAFQIAGGVVGLAGSTGDIGLLTPVVLVLPLLGSVLATLVTQPFIALTVALLHVDARIRSEGYDLVLAQGASEVAHGGHRDGWILS